MDKLSEYIPLIVILVSLLFTIVGKKLKPGNITQETTLPGKTVGEPVPEREIPRIFTGLNRKIVDDKPKKQIIRSEIKEEIASFPATNVTLEPEEEDGSPFSFEEEDLRNAIIYSEIINKKEW